MSSQNQSEAGLHAMDYWQVVKNRYAVILLVFLLVFTTSLVISYVLPKQYESRAVVQVRMKTSEAFLPTLDSGNNMEMSAPTFIPTEFEVITSQKTLDEVITKLDLVNHWNLDMEGVRARLRGIVKAESIRGTSLIQILVRYTDKEDAQAVAEKVMEAYRTRRRSLQSEQDEQGILELNKAVRNQEDQVENKRRLLSTIIRNDQIIFRDPTMQSGTGYNEVDEADQFAKTYVELEQSKIQLESQIETLLKYDGDQLMTYASGLDLPNSVIKVHYPAYLEAKRQVQTLREQGLGDRHPSVLAAGRNVLDLYGNLQSDVTALRETLKAQLELSTQQLEKMGKSRSERKDAAVQDVLAKQQFKDTKEDFDNAQKLLNELKLKQVAEQMQAKVLGDPIVVHEEPVVSNDPVFPRLNLILAIGAVFGLGLGVSVAFLLEYMDTSVKSLEDVERYLQVPVLAVIPKDVGVLYKQGGMSPDAEAYRILRTNIEFNRKNPEDNAITVVSGGAGEGKSTTLCNLAYICAQGGYTTLMIDADLRRPRLHTFFDINNAVGLTNYLTTELMLEDVILQTPVDNLYFMPSGILPADAAGILNSRRMSELIQDVKQRFDLVLIDSPPILGVSDASVLASEVDLTMIVVQHRKLPRAMLVRVKQAVENVGGRVVGVVLNNVDVRSDSQYQYYTSYYTYYAPSEMQAVSTPSSAPQAAQANKPRSISEKPGGDLY